MHNRAEIIGNLGADPDIHTFADGGKVANLRVATSEKWRDKATGETRERVEWHSVAIRAAGLAGVAERYLRKGAKVFISGRLQTRKWQDQEGRDRYSTEIVVTGFEGKLVMLGGRGDGAGDHPPAGGDAGTGAAPAAAADMDDEIPF